MVQWRILELDRLCSPALQKRPSCTKQATPKCGFGLMVNTVKGI